MTLDFMLASIPDTDGKLDVLTSIEITSTDPNVINWSREKRNELCEPEVEVNLLGQFL